MVFSSLTPSNDYYENVVYGLRLKGVKDKKILDEAVEKIFGRCFHLG